MHPGDWFGVEQVHEPVLRPSDLVVDTNLLVWAVIASNADWQKLERYSGPLPPDAVAALEAAGALGLEP
jgi:hypothetical protein